MELKKKTIIWEDNNEPPKDYIWIKSDGKAYEFDYNDRKWKESTSINVNNNDSDDGSGDGGSDSDVFFVPATIQPKYFINDHGTEPIEIKNYTLPINSTLFLYNKEDIISLGVEEEELNSLQQVTINEAYDDFYSNNGNSGYLMLKAYFNKKIILGAMTTNNKSILIYGNTSSRLYKISDDVFLIIEPVSMPETEPAT